MVGDAFKAKLADMTAAGLALFPVRNGRKVPAVSQWPDVATSDLAKIDTLFSTEPHHNVGAATGMASGVFVLDVDCKGVDGHATLADLEAAHGSLPPTWRTKTPSGGLHVWFKLPADREIRNRVGFAPGLDVRGEGGFVLVPPSTLAAPYEWIVPPRSLEAAAAPVWLLDLIAPIYASSALNQPQAFLHDAQRAGRYADGALRGEFRRLSSAPPGQRNETLFKASANLGELIGGGVLDPGLALQALQEGAQNCGLAAESPTEVRATIDSGLRRGLERPRVGPMSDSARAMAENIAAGLMPDFQRTAETGAFSAIWAHHITLPKTAWLVKDLLQARGYGFIYGPSGAGKSFYALDLGMRVASGLQVHDKRTKRRGVIYVAAEGADGVKKRILAWRQENGSTGSLPFVVIPEAPILGSAKVSPGRERGLNDLLARIDEIAAAMRAEGFELGLVIIDTVAASIGGLDENAAGDAGAFTDDLKTISARFSGLTLAIHHSGVSTTDRMRGSSAFNANGDVTIQVNREAGGDVRVVKFQKERDTEDGFRSAFSLNSVQLGVDEDGDPITSAVPVFQAAPAERSTGKPKLADGPRLVLRALRLCLDESQGQPIPPYPGVLPGELGIPRIVLKKRAVEIGYADTSENPDTVRRKLNRDIQTLISRYHIRCENDLMWPL